MTLPVIMNQDRVFFTDAVVYSITMTSTGTAIPNFIGQVKTGKHSVKREFKKVTAAYDTFQSKRATRWDEGTLEITGFDQLTGGKLAAAFVAGATGTFMFQEAASGDLWQFQLTLEEHGVSISADPNESSLKCGIVGAPYYGASGSAVAPIAVGT